MIKLTVMGETPDEEIFKRAEETYDVSGVVADIIKNVRERGDAALFEYCDRFDGGAPESLEVTGAEFEKALAKLEPELVEVLKRAGENIRVFHERQLREGFEISPRKGVRLGQRVHPLEKVTW